MADLTKIKAPIKRDIKEFEPYFSNLTKSKAPLLNIITNYILRRKGKQMRPILVFLSAKLFGDINKSTYNAASLIELMHTATLIHDDVVDASDYRRGFFSINAIWKNKIAVLVGDYFLAKGLLLAVNNKEYELLDSVSTAVKEMSEGELLQIEKSRKLNLTEETYYKIIRKKTAVLLAACASIGASSVGTDKEISSKMWAMGENIGMAFQIKDDIFDYEKNSNAGKPKGNDIKEKKLTLPVIYALNNCKNGEANKIKRIINKKNKKKKDIETIISFVESNKGIEYSKSKMKEYKNKALKIIEDFDNNEAKESIINFINFTTSRNK